MSENEQNGQNEGEEQGASAEKLSRRELLGTGALKAVAGVAMLPVMVSGCDPDAPDASEGFRNAGCPDEPLADLLGVTPVVSGLTLSTEAKDQPFAENSPGLTQLRDAILRRGAFSEVPALAQELLVTVPPAGVIHPGTERVVQSLGWGKVELTNGQWTGDPAGCLVLDVTDLESGCFVHICKGFSCNSHGCFIHAIRSNTEFTDTELVNNLNHPFVQEIQATIGGGGLPELADEIFQYACSSAVDTSVTL